MNRRPRNQATAKTKRSRLDHSLHPHTRPGTIITPPDADPTLLRVTCYGPDHMVDRQNCGVAEIAGFRGDEPVMWIDATGLADADVIEELGQLLGLHPLSLEDLVNLKQRPKVEEYPNHLFAVSQVPMVDGGDLETDQVSVFTGKGFVLTWREHPGPCFDLVRKRLQVTGGVTRSSGVDYLTYAVLDAVVDSFFPVLEIIGDAIDELDERVEQATDMTLIAKMRDIRNDVRQLRRVAWPMRDAIDTLMRKPADLIGHEASIHLRDCHDHVVQIIDTLENCRDACGDIRDYYATAISNRMNEIMKVLTVISTIFMPLSLIAGIYGMNFKRMPELEWPWGYAASLGMMGLVAVLQLIYYYRRGWLRRLDAPPKTDRTLRPLEGDAK